MATFEIKNKQIANQYEYTDENLKFKGSFHKDYDTNVLQKYDGSVFTADESVFIGTVNAELKDGKQIYSIPPTTKEITTLIWAAIDEIEKNINA